MQPAIGVIGGSGLYAIDGLEDVRDVTVETPFGAPSDALIEGTLHGTRMVFLPRHGRGHRLTPSEVPYQANIWALRKVGCVQVLSVSAVGSMKEAIEPGHLVMVDQFIDRTLQRPRTFFGDGVVAHVPFADPICQPLSRALHLQAVELGFTAHLGGTYVCIEGPQFSTRAESLWFRSMGVDVIGMTNLPEARLAREAELCYATVALATDYDCWHSAHEDVTVDAVVATLLQNVAKARALVATHAKRGLRTAECDCQGALRHAVMTAPDKIPAQARERLALLLDPYLPPPVREGSGEQ